MDLTLINKPITTVGYCWLTNNLMRWCSLAGQLPTCIWWWWWRRWNIASEDGPILQGGFITWRAPPVMEWPLWTNIVVVHDACMDQQYRFAYVSLRVNGTIAEINLSSIFSNFQAGSCGSRAYPGMITSIWAMQTFVSLSDVIAGICRLLKHQCK